MEYRGLGSICNEVIGGIIGQILCLYFLIRFVVEFKRNIKKFANITINHAEGICLWIFGLIYFTVNAYFYKNLLHLHIDDTYCSVCKTITNAARVWLQASFYFQFTSAITSVTNISNIPLAVSPKFMSTFRSCVMVCAVIVQILIAVSEIEQKNQKTEKIKDWTTCYIISDFYETLTFKLFQIIIAVIISASCLICAVICVKQTALVNKIIIFCFNFVNESQ